MLKVCRDFVLSYLIFVSCTYRSSDAEKKMVQIINMQHPTVDYVNNSFIRVINATSRRHGRRDLQYYVHIEAQAYVVFDNRYKVHATLDEFLSYTSTRRLFEINLNLCDFLSIVQNKLLYKSSISEEYKPIKVSSDCSMPIGNYYFYNGTWPKAAPVDIVSSEERLTLKLSRNDGIVPLVGHMDLSLKKIPVSKS